MSKKIKMPELGQKVSLVKERPVKPNLKQDAVNLFNIGHGRKDVAELLNIPQYKIDYYYYQVFKKGKGKDVVEPKNSCKLCKKPTEHTFCSKKCYQVYNSEPQDKPKGKRGRPKKVVESPTVPPAAAKRKKGRPKKVQFVPLTLEEHFFGIKSKKKPNKKMVEKNRKRKSDDRKEFIELHDYNPLDDAKEYDSPPNPPFDNDDKPLDAYTKKTVIVGAEKDEIALEFLNSQVISLKKQNQKLLEINNKHVLEISKLKVELNNKTSEAEYEEVIEEYEELVNNLRNKHANQTFTINQLQGVIATLTQEIKNLKEQDITSDELSKKEFEKSIGNKVLNFFIAFMLGLVAAILFMIALA
jgi:hypothetical protein